MSYQFQQLPRKVRMVNGIMAFSKDGKPYFRFSFPLELKENKEKVTAWVNCVAFGHAADNLNKAKPNSYIILDDWSLQTENGYPPMYKDKPQWKAFINSVTIVEWADGNGQPPEPAGAEEELPF